MTEQDILYGLVVIVAIINIAPRIITILDFFNKKKQDLLKEGEEVGEAKKQRKLVDELFHEGRNVRHEDMSALISQELKTLNLSLTQSFSMEMTKTRSDISTSFSEFRSEISGKIHDIESSTQKMFSDVELRDRNRWEKFVNENNRSYSEISNKLLEMSSKLSSIESSTKSAHHRLDDLERKT